MYKKSYPNKCLKYDPIEVGEVVSIRLNLVIYPNAAISTEGIVVEAFGKNYYKCKFNGNNYSWFVREDIRTKQQVERAIKNRYGCKS